MVINLIRKEIVSSIRALTVYMLITTVYLIYMFFRGPAGMYFTISCIFILFAPLCVFAREDKFHAAALNCSLPCTRKSINAARYLFSWTIIVTGMIYSLLIAALMSIVFKGQSNRMAELAAPQNLLNGFLLAMLIFSVVYIFFNRFGWMGLIILLVGFQVLGIIALFAARFFGGKTLHSIVRAIPHTLYMIRDAAGDILFYSGAILAVAVINYVSFRFSESIIVKKEM